MRPQPLSLAELIDEIDEFRAYDAGRYSLRLTLFKLQLELERDLRRQDAEARLRCRRGDPSKRSLDAGVSHYTTVPGVERDQNFKALDEDIAKLEEERAASAATLGELCRCPHWRPARPDGTP